MLFHWPRKWSGDRSVGRLKIFLLENWLLRQWAGFRLLEKIAAWAHWIGEIAEGEMLQRDYRAGNFWARATRPFFCRDSGGKGTQKRAPVEAWREKLECRRRKAKQLALSGGGEVIEQRVGKNLRRRRKGCAIIGLRLAQLRRRRGLIHADQISLLRGKRYGVLLEIGFLRV